MINIINGEVFETLDIVTYRRGYNKQITAAVIGNNVELSIRNYLGQYIDYQNIPIRLSGDCVQQEVIVDDGVLELVGAAGDVIKVETLLLQADNVQLEVMLI